MKKIKNWFCSFLLLFPDFAYADVNSFYDLKLKINQIIDSITGSPLYGIIFYSVSAIVAFLVVVVIVFFLIMLLKR